MVPVCMSDDDLRQLLLLQYHTRFLKSFSDVGSYAKNEEQLAELITEQIQKINSNVENEVSDTEQLLSTTIRATIKLNNENTNVIQTSAKENIENQAKKMMTWSGMKLLPLEVH